MPTAPREEIRKNESTLRFYGIRIIAIPPSQVHFIFALRDLHGRTISRPPEEIAAATRILENNKEIDYTESGFIVTNTAGFQLDVVLVLDFTNSMAGWSEGERNAITVMVEGAKQLIKSLAAAHRVAILEYHDRNAEPSFLTYFTSDQQALIDAINSFGKLPIDHGSSRCWDAVYSGITIFPQPAPWPEAKALLFISDGFDTSSKHTPNEIIALAKQKHVQIYTLGAFAVKDEATLQKLSQETEGAYYRAEDLQQLEKQLPAIAQDLRSQYKVSYVSLRPPDRYLVQVRLDWMNQANTFEQTIDFRSIHGDDSRGQLDFDESVVMNQRAEVFMRAKHLPRNIHEFRFRFGGQTPPLISQVKKEHGGLCEGWQQTSPDAEGYFRFFSPDSTCLRFGDSGILLKATFENITSSGLVVPFYLDNSIYPSNKWIDFPKTLVVGLPILDPQPAHGSSGIDPKAGRLSWRVENPRQWPLKYEVRLDTHDASHAIAAGLTVPNVKMPANLSSNTTYYWRVIAYSSRSVYQGPVWQFRTK